jgi:acetolactate synthase-1/2/3 large subunit
MTRRAADLLVECLSLQGLDRAFCVPGESYLPVLDALSTSNQVDLVTCRHEGGAGYMAVADAKLTGRPGVAFVSRGPGATNASIAVHTAEQDGVPLLLFIGQVSREDIGRGAFQEIDYQVYFGEVAKWVHTVEDAETLPEVIAAAVRIACTPSKGPIVIVLPEDMLDDYAEAEPEGPQDVMVTLPGEADIAAVAEMIASAERPLIIVGGEASYSRDALIRVSQEWSVPVATSFKRQDLFDNNHPHYAGHLGFKIPPAQVEIMGEADLILAVGTRLGDVTTQGYVLPAAPTPDQHLVHVYPDAEVLGRNYETEVGFACDVDAFLEGLAAVEAPQPPEGRGDWIGRLNDHVEQLSTWREDFANEATDGVDFGHVVEAISSQLDDNAVLITDAGNFSSWVHRHFAFGPRHFLVGAVSGAMGMGVPAAVAAGRRLPGHQVITFVGDGGYMMTGNELATAMQYDVPVKIFIANNRSYGTIRLHQEKAFPNRIAATELTNPDFAALAEAFGARGIVIDKVADVAEAVMAALAHDGPVVVEVRSSLDHISAYTTIDRLRNPQ